MVDPSLGVPERVGPYRCLQLLGEGGMGVVYEAEQLEPVRRRVAIKFLKPGLDSREVLARFEAERQALAVMNHPNIAKVLDAGATGARPYFVMELVRGVPITEYCDANRLSTRQRLALFVTVCQAVQHAHQKGVIHRDLKPSNVLVALENDQPVSKTIDFGIAKAIAQPLTDRTLVTAHGQTLGTPAYMSPEQAVTSGLDIDTRSDIYSLGVMLYELLVGRLPVDPKDVGVPNFVMALAMRSTDPPTPSASLESLGARLGVVAIARHTDPGGLKRQLQGDLDWIVMKAMDTERTRRYETANALALDIGRYLRDEPVLARPPTARYRAAKFIRRNRGAVFGAALAVTAIIVGAAFAGVGFVRARAAERTADRHARSARAASDFLADIFRVSDPAVARGGAITARELLDRGADRISTELAGQPAVQAKLMTVIGRVYYEMGLIDKARPLLEGALVLWPKAPDADPLDIGETETQVARLRQSVGEFPGADSAYHAALRIFLAHEGPHGVGVARQLNNLGTLYLSEGQPRRADSLTRAALVVIDGAPDQDRPSAELAGRTPRELSLIILGNLAGLQSRVGDWGEVERLERQWLARADPTLGTDHPLVTYRRINLANSLTNQGKDVEAWGEAERAVAVQERVSGDSSIQLGWGLAAMAIAAADPDSAERLARRAVRIFAQAGADAPGLSNAYLGLAHALLREGRFTDATAASERASDSTVTGPDRTVRGLALNVLAQTMQARGRLSAADSLYAAANAIDSAELGPDYSESVYTVTDMGRVAAYRGDLAHGDALVHRALRDLEAGGAVGALTLESVLEALAVIAVRRGDWAGAAGSLRRVVQSSAVRLGSSDDVRRLAALGALAVALRRAGDVRAGDSAAAEESRVFVRGVRAFIGAPPADSTLSALAELCGAGALMDHPADAVAPCDRAVAIAPDGGSYQAIARAWRGVAEGRTGDGAGAVRDFGPWMGRLKSGPLYAERARWIAALKSGTDPFSDAPRVILLLDDSGY